jgi:O-antigen/teichoic acid export membrane protein
MLTLNFKNVLARNTLWMSAGQGLRLLIQALFFTAIARSLGVRNYGAFVGVVALVGILYPFGSLGSGNLMVKGVARDKGLFSTMWGAALATTTFCGAILIAVVVLLSTLALPPTIPKRLVLLVAISDIFGLNVITIACQAFQAFEQLHWTAAINVFLSAIRLSGVLVLVAICRHPSALQWGYVYTGTAAIVAAFSSGFVYTKLGPPRLVFGRSLAEFREGFYFSISLSAQTIYNDIDKTMLARLGTLDATGIYGAAYRLIDVTVVPVQALLYAAYPNFFRKGAAGVSYSFSYAKPLLKRAMGYGILVCFVVLLLAGIVPYVLGADYARTTEALRWLSLLPFLKAMHYFLSDTLTGAGFQGLRSGIQTGVAIFNVIINLWLIPLYSWRGAAWSSIASDALLASAVGTAVWILSKRSRRVLGQSQPRSVLTL